MRRLMISTGLCAVTSLAVAAGAAADKSLSAEDAGAKLCVAEKQADKAAFNSTYGEHAMRDCKRSHRDDGAEAVQNASQECGAERDADPAAFAATYGSNDNDKNAFGKCVSSKVKEIASEEAEVFANAAQECRAERSDDPEAFTTTYGTNRNGKNAFGKCVKQRVHEDQVAPPTA